MAAQPKRKYSSVKHALYLIDNCEGKIKIGISENPVKRIATIRTGSGYKNIEIIRLEWFDTRKQARDAESACHFALNEYRVSGEWFEIDNNVAVPVVVRESNKVRGNSITEISDVEFEKSEELSEPDWNRIKEAYLSGYSLREISRAHFAAGINFRTIGKRAKMNGWDLEKKKNDGDLLERIDSELKFMRDDLPNVFAAKEGSGLLSAIDSIATEMAHSIKHAEISTERKISLLGQLAVIGLKMSDAGFYSAS